MAKNNLESIEINLGRIEKIIQGAGRSGLDYERASRQDPPHAEAHVGASKTFFFQKISVQLYELCAISHNITYLQQMMVFSDFW